MHVFARPNGFLCPFSVACPATLLALMRLLHQPEPVQSLLAETSVAVAITRTSPRQCTNNGACNPQALRIENCFSLLASIVWLCAGRRLSAVVEAVIVAWPRCVPLMAFSHLHEWAEVLWTAGEENRPIDCSKRIQIQYLLPIFRPTTAAHIVDDDDFSRAV